LWGGCGVCLWGCCFFFGLGVGGPAGGGGRGPGGWVSVRVNMYASACAREKNV
jgi:hypothetical protein